MIKAKQLLNFTLKFNFQNQILKSRYYATKGQYFFVSYSKLNTKQKKAVIHFVIYIYNINTFLLLFSTTNCNVILISTGY